MRLLGCSCTEKSPWATRFMARLRRTTGRSMKMFTVMDTAMPMARLNSTSHTRGCTWMVVFSRRLSRAESTVASSSVPRISSMVTRMNSRRRFKPRFFFSSLMPA